MPHSDSDTAHLIGELQHILGAEYVLTGLEDREFYSTDMSFRPHEIAELVIQPNSVDELAAAVGAATRAGLAVVPRGGGLSYTLGYTPERKASMSVDMRRMNRILEVNIEDMYVVVECGCTWKTLYETLSEKGVRTPFWGPFSGKFATVGGSLSQNAAFYGSALYRTAVESVIGFQIVLAQGEILTTGSGAHKNSTPFYRYFGPDITGLFTADTGAMGLKAIAVLRLITKPKHTGYLSFAFDTLLQMLKAQSRISRLYIASECYGLDPYYNAGFESRGLTFAEGLSKVGQIARKGGLKGIGRAAKMALAGKRVLRNVQYSLHMSLDGHTERVAAEHTDMAAEICVSEGGRELVNSIPIAFRETPYEPIRTVLVGSDGEIWLPVHALFPLSRAAEAAKAVEAFFAERKDLMEKWGIRRSYLTLVAGTDMLIEPSLYWFDELGKIRLEKIEPKFAEKWQSIRANEGTRKVALQIRDELRDLLGSLGGMHFQLGKYYHYTSMMKDDTLSKVLRGIKAVLDPQNMINPGSLGLR